MIDLLSTLILGRGEVRVGDSVDWDDNNTAVLDSTYSLGRVEECTISNELEHRTKRNVENISDVKKILTKNNVFLDFTVLEATQENLQLLLTGNINNRDFYFGERLFESLYRVEVKFLYPNKKDYMIVIFPKMKIISTSDLNLVSLSEPNKPSFSFQSFPLDNATWGKNLGKVVFGQN